MATLPTQTLGVTIDAPIEQVTRDLADPSTHPGWATEFFAGPARADDDEWIVSAPRMGGDVHMRIDSDVPNGRVDMYLAPVGAPYGPPLPIRVVPNGDGCDVLFTLTRFPGQPDEQWQPGLLSMQRELDRLRVLYEG